MADLLVELRTEEIPAGYLEPALSAFCDEVRRGLEEAGIAFDEVIFLGTPRRMTVAANNLADRQPDRQETAVGPAEKAAFAPDGSPTRAAQGFARSHGVAVADLEVRETPKGRYVCVQKQIEGQATLGQLPDILTTAVSRIPFPKRMRWAARDFLFARPIRGLVALLRRAGRVVVSERDHGGPGDPWPPVPGAGTDFCWPRRMRARTWPRCSRPT